MDRWAGRWMDEQMTGWMDRWMIGGWVGWLVDGWRDRWMDRQVDQQVRRWMDGWMDDGMGWEGQIDLRMNKHPKWGLVWVLSTCLKISGKGKATWAP